MWILERLKEKSTWVGLVGYAVTLLSQHNILIPAEWQQATAEAGFLITSIILIIIKEKKS
jgi:uncharacterized membrane protein